MIIKECSYNVKKGCWKNGTRGNAKKIGSLWLFQPFNDDHKVIIDENCLVFDCA